MKTRATMGLGNFSLQVRAINILEKRDEGHKDVIGGRK
jgi:hypothetical protein